MSGHMIIGLIPTLKMSIIQLKDNPVFHAFLWIIVLDVLTGIAKATKQKKVNSSTGLNGLIRHMTIIILVFLLTIYLPIFEFGAISKTILIYFILMYMVSILENLEAIGVNMPDWVHTYVTKMHREVNAGYEIKNVDKVDVHIKSKK